MEHRVTWYKRHPNGLRHPAAYLRYYMVRDCQQLCLLSPLGREGGSTRDVVSYTDLFVRKLVRTAPFHTSSGANATSRGRLLDEKLRDIQVAYVVSGCRK